MARDVLVVPSAAKPGRDDEYNEWYDTRHLADLLALPGVISGKRFDADPASPGTLPGPYLAIYEIETDDVNAFLAAMGQRAAAGAMPISDALDTTSAHMWFYKAH